MLLEREKGLIEVPITGTSPGLTATITEVADLPAIDSGFGLRNLAERICMSLELRMESKRLEKSSSGSQGRNPSGREWIANWTALGARWKGNEGESPTGNDRFSCVVRASKYGAKAAAGLVGLETRRVTDPLSLTLAVMARGSVQFASLRTRAAISEKVAAIRVDSGCSVGGERGA